MNALSMPMTSHFASSHSVTEVAPRRKPDESGVFFVGRQELALVPTSQDEMIESDMKLISQLLLNRPSAWREFQARYERLISRCIMKVTRRFSSIVSQDDVCEVYAQLFVSLLTNNMHKLRSFDPARGNGRRPFS